VRSVWIVVVSEPLRLEAHKGIFQFWLMGWLAWALLSRRRTIWWSRGSKSRTVFVPSPLVQV